MLTDLDFDQAADMIAHAGVSPRVRTRQHSLIAWGVLATATESEERQNRAVDGLVDAALCPVQGSGDQEQIMAAAVDEIARLKESLRHHAYRAALDRARTGSRDGGLAARLALMLAAHEPLRQKVKSYWLLRLARFLTVSRTWIECFPVVGAIAIVIALGMSACLAALNSVGRGQFPPSAIGAGVLIFTAVSAAMLAAGISIPTRILSSGTARVAEALLQPLVVSLAVLVTNGIRITITGDGDFVPLGRVQEFPQETSMFGDYRTLLIPVAGLVIARAVGFTVPARRSLARGLGTLLVVAGGWAAAGMFAASALLVRSEAAEHAVGRWPLWLVSVFAALAGLAWAESRAAGTARPDAIQKVAAAETTRPRRWAVVATGGAALTIATVLVASVLLRTDTIRLDEQWNQGLAPRVKSPITVDCGAKERSSQIPMPRQDIEPGSLYPIAPCPDAEVHLIADPKHEGPSSDDAPFRAVYILDRSYFFDRTARRIALAGWLLFFPAAERVNPGRGPYYLCVEVEESTCIMKPRANVDLAAALVLRVVDAKRLAHHFETKPPPPAPAPMQHVSIVARQVR